MDGQRAQEAQATQVSKRFCYLLFVPLAESLVFSSIPPRGLEPLTYCLEGSCSVLLSYGGANLREHCNTSVPRPAARTIQSKNSVYRADAFIHTHTRKRAQDCALLPGAPNLLRNLHWRQGLISICQEQPENSIHKRSTFLFAAHQFR